MGDSSITLLVMASCSSKGGEHTLFFHLWTIIGVGSDKASRGNTRWTPSCLIGQLVSSLFTSRLQLQNISSVVVLFSFLKQCLLLNAGTLFCHNRFSHRTENSLALDFLFLSRRFLSLYYPLFLGFFVCLFVFCFRFLACFHPSPMVWGFVATLGFWVHSRSRTIDFKHTRSYN